jgi:hypothetical protein
MDDVQPENAERPDPVRLRYWARLIKLLRDPWPPRSLLPTRSAQPPRSPELPRQLEPSRLGDDA